MPEREIMMVKTMCGSEEEALKIAGILLDEHLIACANLLAPAKSVFRWEGAVETGTEFMLLMKTQKKHVGEITARITHLHSYELPEISALPIEDGSAQYLQWVADET